MHVENFNRILDFYIEALDQYTFGKLCSKSSLDSWSLGQMYLHLIDDTRFYIDQIKVCLSGNDHSDEKASGKAKAMLRNNDFPDALIEGSPNNAFIPQPENKEQLSNHLLNLKGEINQLAITVSQSSVRGKTRHPGLGYLSANEWLQLIEMHFRHHLRQKKRIDDFLMINN